MKHKREYIGDTLTVLSSSNTSLEGRTGRIINETQQTFTVTTNTDTTITILKNPCVFRIGDDTINGSTITKQPAERLKL
jgi:RNase P/RNase MRP subunit p29